MGNTLSCCRCPNASPKPGRRSKRGRRSKSELSKAMAGDAVAVAAATEAGDAVAVATATEAGGAVAVAAATEAGEAVAVEAATATVETAKLDFRGGEGHHLQHIVDREMPEDLAVESNPFDHPRASTSQMDVQEKRKSNHLNHCDLSNILPHKVQPVKIPEECYKHDPQYRFVNTFVQTIFSAMQLTSECAIMTLVYLERLLTYAEINLYSTAWRRIVLGAILIASKDNQAVWKLGREILQGLTLENMIEIVSHCLELLHFDIDVPASVYAKYYFGLRSLAGDNDRNFLSAPLSKERAQNLKVISRLSEDKDTYFNRASLRRSFSADDFIVIQRSNAILS